MDIDYNNCNRYKEVEKKSGKGVVGECEYIAGLRAEAESNKERLKEGLVKASLGPIRGIYTREVAMQVVRGELVDPIMGESLRNGKVTFKGGLLAEGISKGIAYIKNEQVKTKIKNWEIRNQEERMRMEVEGLTKNEAGRYEFSGGVVEGGVGDSYKCKAGICKADDSGKIGGSKTGGNTAGNKEEKWSKILVKKGHTVWGMYNNKPTSAELEEFIKRNPYIAARGVVRDANGNIKHLEIRAGEEISVPKDIATSYKAGYTPAINRIKDSSGDVQDVCLDPNAGDKYGNIFGAQNALFSCAGESCSNSILQLASYSTTQNNDLTLEENKNEFIEILTKESKIYFDIKIKEFTNNPKNIGPFELLKTVVGYELHMAGVAVDKLGDKYPNVAKGANKVIEIINIPFEWVGEKAVNGYKYAKKELIEEISNKYGEQVGRKVEMYINRGEVGIANSLSKYAPTDKQEKALKFLEGIGVSKLAKDIAIGGVKKVFTKPDTPHHKTLTDTGHNVDGDSHLGGSANEFTNTNAQFSKKGAWGHWSDYEKVAINGKEYAKIGDWLYTRHAVENLYPSKMGRAPGHTSNHDHLNLPPKFVNDIISNKNSKFAEVKKDGATRRIYDANDIRIITEGKVVITIYKNKINK